MGISFNILHQVPLYIIEKVIVTFYCFSLFLLMRLLYCRGGFETRPYGNAKNMKKLLLTGASGFLGWNICQEAKGNLDIYGTVFTNPVDIPGTHTLRTDLSDFSELKQIFSDIEPDMVIHGAALSKPEYCEVNREEAKKINVDASVNIAGLCADRQIPMVFTSTDHVFDGHHAPYKEDDPVSPVNCYSEQKVLAEEGILKTYPSASVCRMPLMFGDPGPAGSSFYVTMVNSFKEGGELNLFVDEFRTPVSAKTAAQGLLLALEKAQGILHLGGCERISRYHFGLLMMDTMGIPEANIIRCRQKDVTMSALRPPDLSMDSSKAFALGFKPLPLRDELQRLLSSD
jgi:dTDP-4-dehydrorhamnose reductase